MEDTLEVLKSNGAFPIGIYGTPHEYFVFSRDDVSIGIYSIAEHDYGLENFNVINSVDNGNTKAIRRLKDKCSFVLVLYHGGEEF